MKEFNQFSKSWTIAAGDSISEILPATKIMNQLITVFAPAGLENVQVIVAGIDMALVEDYVHTNSGSGAILQIPFPITADIQIIAYNDGRTDAITLTVMGGNM